MTDEGAKEAVQLHQQPTPEQRALVVQQLKDLPILVKWAIQVLPRWPQVSKQELRDAEKVDCRPPVERRPLAKHQWSQRGKRWQCEFCWTSAFKPRSRRKHDASGCLRDSAPLRSILRDNRVNDHLFRAADTQSPGPPCVSCAKCGAWASIRPQRLVHLCRGLQVRN